MDALEELQGATATVAVTAGPAVVGLRFGWRPASGVVIARDRVLTCAHAVRRDEVAVTFADGRRATGRPAAVDGAGDLAVIAVETGDAPAIAWREEPAELGTPVFALARLGDGALRVTSGAVSALARSFRGPRGRRIAGSVEHTAAVARGSAGGPLVDAAGRLVGLSSVRLDGGLVLALTADADLHARAEELARGEAPVRRTLGVGVVSSRAARRMRRAVGLPEREGLLVREVQAGGPAAAAGVEAGDLIVAAAGTPVTSIDDLHAALDAADDPAIALGLVRGEAEREVVVHTVEG
ncbi:MAG TPA: serine protease [Gaiellales bacterium]|jgi:serine protease Do|nr:serine protease [Gaiellales bacterium]